MGSSFLQYLLLAPSFTNVLNVYAFCNLHDVGVFSLACSKLLRRPLFYRFLGVPKVVTRPKLYRRSHPRRAKIPTKPWSTIQQGIKVTSITNSRKRSNVRSRSSLSKKSSRNRLWMIRTRRSVQGWSRFGCCPMRFWPSLSRTSTDCEMCRTRMRTRRR